MSKQYVLGQKPVINRARSAFPMSYKHLTSFNVGDLVPLYFQDVLPGDTFKVKSYNVIRTTTPFIKPVMDNLVFDMYYFFVPMRLVWENTEEFFGENKTGYWTQQQTFEIPTVSGPVTKNTIADYLGIPPLNYGEDESYLELNILPFRAYALIWNEWFRSENLQEPVYIYKGSNISGVLPYFNNNDFGPSNFLGKCAKVNKLQDYFTSCLPAPQKGDAVTLKFSNGTFVNNYVDDLGQELEDSPVSLFADAVVTKLWNDSGDVPANLDLSGVDIANVNDLRMAFALQRMLEKDARGGTRYIEYIQEHFSVTNPDYRLQRPEFLGGKRMPLNIQQVASTNGDGVELGSLGAYSLSNGECGFNKGFTEHGFIIGVGCVRYKHTYSQGLERIWTKKLRTDIYDPVFANIGEQPVYAYELDTNVVFETGDILNRVFGYNEAWAHYRYKPNRVSAEMRPDSGSGLDVYHFADNYNNVPVLGSEFIEETSLFVDRTLSADSDAIPNFIADFYHDVKAIRCMPTYSIPGLVDHK